MPAVSFDPTAPVIILSVKIKGRIVETARMALDTGATYVMIPWDLAESLGYQPGRSRERIEMVTASGVERAPLITLQSVRLAGLEAQRVKALVHDLPPRSFVDGLLGLSFLRNFKFCLDFERGLLELFQR
ncbi:MAG: TIGR02281 family clan AA aspartic protease [Candidatus Bipolaricaulia bacterium]